MAGTWPNLDASDMETRIRTYLNEVSANFYTQAEIWRWLSIGAKDIAQKTLCVRRIIDATTTTSTRAVNTSAYKVMHVEYIPSSGREQSLEKIDPLKLGHYKSNGTVPQYWYEYGNTIGIEPIPDATYNLRLYVADSPKMQHSTFPITAWNSGWTGSGTGTWTNGATNASYSGTTGQAGINTYGTALTANTRYTFIVTASNVSTCGLVITAGGTASPSITTSGVHAVNLTTSTTSLTLTATVSSTTGTFAVDDLYILKEADFAATTDQIEFNSTWQHLLCLYATIRGLYMNRKPGPASMLEGLYVNELEYLRQNIVEVIPGGTSSMKQQ
jgi:hypothetical protein